METKDKHVPLVYRAEVSRIEKSILELWKDNADQEFNTTTIVAAMDKMEVHRHKTLRYLKRLVDSRSLERRVDNQQVLYKLRLHPEDFNQLEYVTKLDSAVSCKNMKYEWGVGGAFSHLACGSIVGFPPIEKDTDPDVAFVLNILLQNAAETFASIEYLREVILLRRAGVHIKIPNEVLRILILLTHVKALDEELGETNEVARKLIPSLHYWKNIVEYLWKKNRTNTSDPADPNDGIVSMNMMESFEKLLATKNYLKNEGFELSHYRLSELAEKIRKMEEKMEEFATAAFARSESQGSSGMRSVLFPKEMSEQHSLLALAYSAKLAELYASLGLQEKQDMALVITRSPRTMDKQTTEEHILSEFIDAAREYNEELKTLSGEQAAKFLGQRFGELYINTPRQEIDSLRERPWLSRALGGYVDAFYEAYHAAREERISFEEKLDREFYAKYGH
jgi:hypothetical protein